MSKIHPALSLMLVAITGLHSEATVVLRHGEELHVSVAKETDSGLWLIAGDGILYSVAHYDIYLRFPQPDAKATPHVFDVDEVDGEIWLGTAAGIYKLEEADGKPVVLGPEVDDRVIKALVPEAFRKQVWLWRNDDVVLVDLVEKKCQPFLEGESVRSLGRLANGSIFVATAQDLYYFDQTARAFVGMIAVGGPIRNIVEAVILNNGDVFAKALGPRNWEAALYKIRDGKAVLVADNVGAVAASGDKLWYSQSRRNHRGFEIRRIQGGSYTFPGRFNGINEFANDLLITKDFVWTATTEGLYAFPQRNGRDFQQIANHPRDLNLNGFLKTKEGALWAWGASGLFRIYEDVEIEVVLNTIFFNGVHLLIDDDLEIIRADYLRNGDVAFPTAPPETTYQGILALDEEDLRVRLERAEFLDLPDVAIGIQDKRSEALAVVRDSYGNLSEVRRVQIVSFSAWRSAAVRFFLLFLLLAMFVVVLIFLALRKARASAKPQLRAPMKAALDDFGTTARVRIFISYSHADKMFATKLSDALNRCGVGSWMDRKDMLPGQKILDAVREAINSNDRVLLCCSKDSLSSSWVDDEINITVERERSEGRLILIPLDLDGYLFQWGSGLAARVRSRLAADFIGWEQDNAKFEEQFERVVRALRTDDDPLA